MNWIDSISRRSQAGSYKAFRPLFYRRHVRTTYTNGLSAEIGLYLGRSYVEDKEYEKAMRAYSDALEVALAINTNAPDKGRSQPPLPASFSFDSISRRSQAGSYKARRADGIFDWPVI